MPSDPGLAGDTCIFMESVTGDGGVHNANVWWLSPDIILNGPQSGPDKADPGQINPVEVKFHRKGVESDCTFPGAESLTVELYAGNPSIAMTPNNPASTALIQSIGTPVPAEGADGSQIIDWTPPPGVPSSDPQSKGHKCLIARSYPDNLTPAADKFFVPDDQHVAQRNICIVPCDGSGAARRPGPCGLSVNTINLNPKEAEKVTLRVLFDQRPVRHVLETVKRSLSRTEGFKRLSPRPPQGFSLGLRDFPHAEINDQTKPSLLATLLGRPRSYQAVITLAPGQLIRTNFMADLRGAEFGDAYIFHLMQFGSDRSPQGGLTVVLVA